MDKFPFCALCVRVHVRERALVGYDCNVLIRIITATRHFANVGIHFFNSILHNQNKRSKIKSPAHFKTLDILVF